MMQPLLRDKQVAALLNMNVNTLRHWRKKGLGPKPVKIESSVRYREEDLAAYIASSETK